VRRFKGCAPLPKASAPKTIAIEGRFDHWRDVGPEFQDRVGDTAPRDHGGTTGQRYSDHTGRNDLAAMKVARDDDNVYFYVRTREPITPRTDPNWMQLLIDADQNAATGWEGYDFIVNRVVESDGTTWLENWDSGRRWKKVVRVRYRVSGKELQMAIPREALGLRKGVSRVSFDFKWADNVPASGDVRAFYVTGDVAPEGRFMYRYDGRE
jgi:hypothetical protein